MIEQTDWHKKAFYRVSLKALIRNDKNEILMVSEYDKHNISIPGGGLEYGETPHECLKRELYEEIGLKSEFKERLVHVQTVWRETKHAWLMWITYEILYDELDFSVGKDAVHVKWVDENAIETTTDLGKMITNVLEVVS
jgi:8-oxo-dGTP diphosphatase